MKNSKKAIYTIGYGGIKVDLFIKLLELYNIQYVIDVRSNPQSSNNADFSQLLLSQTLKKNGIKYVFLGDKLGGKPNYSDCYDENGYVLYDQLRTKESFLEGIQKLTSDFPPDENLCILCLELKPENCHRSKLIGESLSSMNLGVKHILVDGSIEDQETTRIKLSKNQFSMFKEQLSSRKKYNGREKYKQN